VWSPIVGCGSAPSCNRLHHRLLSRVLHWIRSGRRRKRKTPPVAGGVRSVRRRDVRLRDDTPRSLRRYDPDQVPRDFLNPACAGYPWRLEGIYHEAGGAACGRPITAEGLANAARLLPNHSVNGRACARSQSASRTSSHSPPARSSISATTSASAASITQPFMPMKTYMTMKAMRLFPSL
jgi:hypothetical protein